MPINTMADDAGVYSGQGPAATLWEAPNYRGRSLPLVPGRHAVSFSPASLQMPGRVEVTLFETETWTGPLETFRGNVPYVGARNDQSRSVQVVALDKQVNAPPAAPGVPPPLPPGTPPSPPGLPPPSQADANRWYAEGYDDASRGRPNRHEGESSVPVPWDRFYYEGGYLDAKAGRPRRTVLAAPPPRPADRNAPSQESWKNPWDPTVGYELCAYFSVLRDPTVFGKAVPLEIAQLGESLLAGFSFVILGDDPSDWGSEGRGFRLSGKNGRAVQLAQKQFPGQRPEEQKLPAWICAMTLRGPRLMSRAALDTLLAPGWA